MNEMVIKLEEVVVHSICPYLSKLYEQFIPKEIDISCKIFGEKFVEMLDRKLNLVGIIDILDRNSKKFYVVVPKDNPLCEEVAKRRAIGLYFMLEGKYEPYIVNGLEVRRFKVLEEERYELLKWIANFVEDKEREPKFNVFCEYCPLFGKCPLFEKINL